MKKAILLGTDHPTQLGTNQKEGFSFYLEQLCKTHGIKAIAEEIDVPSIAAGVSAKLDIKYIIIEPNEDERIELGIEDRADIDAEFRRVNKVKDYSEELSLNNLSAQEYEKYDERTQNVYRQRELEWLRRIKNIGTWPVLIICGANHCQPFFDLLSKEGINTVKESSEWAICQHT